MEADDKEIAFLREKLAQSERNVQDFEQLALVWKDAYEKEVPKLKAKITNLEQIIEDMENSQ